MRKRSKRTPKEEALYKRLANYKYGEREWLLTDEDAFSFFLGNCHYCGSPSDPLRPHGIDRVSNELPYTPENTITSCRICNTAKGTMTVVEFRDWVNKVHATVNRPAFLQNTNIGLAAQSGTFGVHICMDGKVRTATTPGMESARIPKFRRLGSKGS